MNFMLWPLYPGKRIRYVFNRRADWPQSRYLRFWRRENFLLLSGFEPRTDKPVAYRYPVVLFSVGYRFNIYVFITRGYVPSKAVPRYGPTFHCGLSATIPVQFMSDLWWTKWYWDRFLFEYFSFTLSVSFYYVVRSSSKVS